MAKVLITGETGYESYFLLQEEDDFAAVALHLLRQRHKQGYYYGTVAQWEERIALALSNAERRVEQVSEALKRSLSPGALAELEAINSKKALAAAQRYVDEYKGHIAFLEALEPLLELPVAEALKQVYTLPSGRVTPLSVYLLEERQDYQYEDWTTEDFTPVVKE